MNLLAEWLRRLWYLLNRRRFERMLRDEMAAHRAEMDEPRRFGNDLRLREASRDLWGWAWLDDLVRDLRLASRTLRRSPGFALTSVVTLALGLGVNLAFFQIVYATLLAPAPVPDPATFAQFYRRSQTSTSNTLPYPLFEAVRSHTTVLSSLLALRIADASLGDQGDVPAAGAFVSAGWFDVLGGSALAGRVLHDPLDDSPDAPPVIVLSAGLWRRHFDARPDIVGATLRVNDRPALVVGIAAPDFGGVGRGVDPQWWMPIAHVDAFYAGNALRTDWSRRQGVQVFGRFPRGLSVDAVRAATRSTMAALQTMRPTDVAADEWLDPLLAVDRFMSERARQDNWPMLAAAQGLIGLVFLIACLNLGNLTLARTVSRVHEMSVRAALGGGRWRVVRHLVTESAVVATTGAIGGLVCGWMAARTIATLAELPPHISVVPDWRVVAVAFSGALVAIFAVGFLPAWKVARRDLAVATRDGGERLSLGLTSGRLRHWLVAGQVGASAVLLVFAVQTIRGLQRLLTEDLGFEHEQVAVLEPWIVNYGLNGHAAADFWADVRGRLAPHPETAAMSLVASNVPLGLGVSSSRYPSMRNLEVMTFQIEPEYFAVMQVPIVAGRTFLPHEDAQSVVIVSRRLAVETYGTPNVVGQGFPKGSPTPVVVGVAADAHVLRLQDAGVSEIYRPIDPKAFGTAALIVRAKTDAAALVAPLREAARAADRRVLAAPRLMRDDFARAVRTPRLASLIAGVTASLAVALACLGIFGVIAYAVGLRVREIGIRMALGATGAQVVRGLLRTTAVAGGLGLVGAIAASRALGKLFASAPLYLLPPDVPAWAAVVVAFGAAGALSAVLPTWRAVRADPWRTLR